jgi:hypothetical protein
VYKILSFDGGGLRGLISAVWLNEIQSRLNHEIVSYFDLIAGNSTGSIIAAGLAVGYTPQDIINIYQHEGSTIFPPFWKVALSKLRRLPTHGISSPKYDGKGLREVLKKYFVRPDGTEIKFTLDDMNGRRLLIPSYNMTIGAPTFFKNYRGEFDHLSVTDVLLSSTAAPSIPLNVKISYSPIPCDEFVVLITMVFCKSLTPKITLLLNKLTPKVVPDTCPGVRVKLIEAVLPPETRLIVKLNEPPSNTCTLEGAIVNRFVVGS